MSNNTFTLIKHESLFKYAELLQSGMGFFFNDAKAFAEANPHAAGDTSLWLESVEAYKESVRDSGAYAALLNHELDADGKAKKDENGKIIPRDGLAAATIKRYIDKAGNAIIAFYRGLEVQTLDEANESGVALLKQELDHEGSNRTGTSTPPKMTAKEMKEAVAALFAILDPIVTNPKAKKDDYVRFATEFASKFDALRADEK